MTPIPSSDIVITFALFSTVVASLSLLDGPDNVQHSTAQYSTIQYSTVYSVQYLDSLSQTHVLVGPHFSSYGPGVCSTGEV